MKTIYIAIGLSAIATACLEQTENEVIQTENEVKDSLYIQLFQDSREPDKVLHAEPLYIDLIRDLGARKGEKEWNVGFGLADNFNYDSYKMLVEYEWAPINRLGFEVEMPFTFYTRNSKDKTGTLPANRIEGLKTALQYSFFVSQKMKTTLALGYLNELHISDFNTMRNSSFLKGNTYNPFFIAAKRWGENYHTLVYAGPHIEQDFKTAHFYWASEINTSFHYMITGTRNFVGIEFNKKIERDYFNMIIRPQMRVGIAENILIGVVAGIPTSRSNERLSMFLRLIYEPGHKKKSNNHH